MSASNNGLLALSILTVCAVVSHHRPAMAQAQYGHRIALTGGFDARIRPEFGGHGYGLLAYDLEGLPAQSQLALSYNTDTFRFAYDRIRFANGYLEAGVSAEYEFSLAGLLTDYFRAGLLDLSRGFNASYVQIMATLKGNLPYDNYLELAFLARRWMFDANEYTDPMLDIPVDLWVLTPRLSYTFWRLEDDPSLRERHRVFPRIRGAAFGLTLALDFRTESAPFGARNSEEFDPIDPRNAGETTVITFRQWFRGGIQVTHYFRIQVAQHFGWGQGEDDLTRTRIGGMNPYVVSLAGAPWAAILSNYYMALQLSLHFRLYRELEFGLLADGMVVEDPRRIGEQDAGMLGGLGAFVDLRFGAFQVDIRGGWTPSLGRDKLGNWNIFGAVGWGWRSR